MMRRILYAILAMIVAVSCGKNEEILYGGGDLFNDGIYLLTDGMIEKLNGSTITIPPEAGETDITIISPEALWTGVEEGNKYVSFDDYNKWLSVKKRETDVYYHTFPGYDKEIDGKQTVYAISWENNSGNEARSLQIRFSCARPQKFYDVSFTLRQEQSQ